MDKLQVLYYRPMFACNSSSTHGVCILDKANIDQLRDLNIDKGYFSWDNFVAVSYEQKIRYFAATVFGSLSAIIPEQYARDIIAYKYKIEDCPSIDHQSQITIPIKKEYGSNYYLNEEFIDDLEKFFLRKDVAIFGGNDNDDPNPHMTRIENREDVSFLSGYSSKELRARKDGNVWTLFNKSNGHKTRISFAREEVVYDKASAPELVDIKITDHCNNNCSCQRHCYQSSSPEGKHADQYEIVRIFSSLRRIGVFEVALGGGEPTSHPNFLYLLRSANAEDLTVNFTTRNLEWLKDEKYAMEVFNSVGSIAFSVHDSNDLIKLAYYRNAYNIPYNKIVIQHTCNTISSYYFSAFLKMVKLLNFNLVLLGYKQVGNAAKLSKPFEYNILDVTNENDVKFFGIDTSFAQEYSEQLKEARFKDQTIETVEGKFSMYIDAVKNVYGKSSYHVDSFVNADIMHTQESILSYFRSI